MGAELDNRHDVIDSHLRSAIRRIDPITTYVKEARRE